MVARSLPCSERLRTHDTRINWVLSCSMQKAGAAAAEDAADDEDAEDVAAAGANFDYLLDMALKSLTEEKVP